MTEGPENQPNAENNQRDTDENAAPIIRPEASGLSQQTPSNTENQEPRKKRWCKDPAMLTVEIAGVIAVIAYTTVAAWQAHLLARQLKESEAQTAATHTAATAAQSAAQTAAEALYLSERAYIVFGAPQIDITKKSARKRSSMMFERTRI